MKIEQYFDMVGEKSLVDAMLELLKRAEKDKKKNKKEVNK